MNPPNKNPYPTTSNSNSKIITINVGGQLFQTTHQTLTLSGPNSILSTIITSQQSNHDDDSDQVPFFDRDPELFSIILNLLRTGNCNNNSNLFPTSKGIKPSFDFHDLVVEAQFYGVESLLIDSVNNPSQFDPYMLEKSLYLPLNGRDVPSAIGVGIDGSVHVAHGSKITSFDWSLSRKKTMLTEFNVIDSLLAVSPSLVAAGATDFSGLQVIDTAKGDVSKTLDWENVTKSGSTVQAIGCSDQFLFASFESGRRNSNAIVVYDLVDDFRLVSEIAHNEIYGADIDSAVPATKLQWVPSYSLLMAAGFHSGPSGVTGNIKLWDVRSGSVAWEVKEAVDCFSDVTVSDGLLAMFKVGVNTGEVFFIDLRNLSSEISWVCLGDARKFTGGKKEGLGCKIESHGSHVFCSKDGDLELWSEVMIDASTKMEDALGERVLRRNSIGRPKDVGSSRITNLCFGGNKMFITRKDQQSVEVWQS